MTGAVLYIGCIWGATLFVASWALSCATLSCSSLSLFLNSAICEKVRNYNKYLFLETLFFLLDLSDLLRKRSDCVWLAKSTLESAFSVLESSLLYLVHLFVLEKFTIDFNDFLLGNSLMGNIRVGVVNQTVILMVVLDVRKILAVVSEICCEGVETGHIKTHRGAGHVQGVGGRGSGRHIYKI